MSHAPTQNRARDGSVLLVDDDPTARRITRRTLRACRTIMDIEEVSDSTRAVPLAMAMQPDLILLDLMMPGLDGLEVCRRLRECEVTRDIPIFMLTAYHEEATKLHALAYGADAFLRVFVDRAELCTRVDAALEAARSRRLRAVEQTATVILDSAPVGALLLSREGHLQHCNAKARGLLGGQSSLSDTLRAADAERLQHAIATVRVHGQPITLRVIQAVSPPRQIEVAVHPVSLRDSACVLVFVLDASGIADVAGTWVQDANSREEQFHRRGLLHDVASLLQVGYLQQGMLHDSISDPQAVLKVAHGLRSTLDDLRSLFDELHAMPGVAATTGPTQPGPTLAELLQQLD